MAEARSCNSPDTDGYLVSLDDLTRLGNGDAARGRAALRLLLADERDREPINGPVKKPKNIRLATVRDEPALLDLLLEDLRENAIAVAEPSIRRIMEQIETGTRGKGGFVPVIDDDDGPVALAIITADKWWWSDEIFLREIVLYVSPKARGGRAGADLLDYECWLSDQMSASYGHRVRVLAGVTATRRADPKLRLYRRHMNRVGGFFCYPAIEGGLP